ncbi:MAG TPA: hypothetical protein VIT38_16905 [Allosphingosinicella sp.]
MIKNYKVIDMPSLMQRKVLKQDPRDITTWISDETWYDQIRMIYRAFILFLEENKLLKKPVDNDIDQVVIWLADLSERGRGLIESGAYGRWLDSFDRPGSKKSLSDTSYLQRALKKLQ